MAFIRWRRSCCELIATVYENGRSKKVTLANIHEFSVSEGLQQEIAEKFPGIKVDWLAVNRAIAQGPPGFLTKSTPPEHLDMATIEHLLRKWADDLSGEKRPKEAECLRAAAHILTGIRADFYWANCPTRRSRPAGEVKIKALTSG
jgi:hypothetical protein